MRVPFIKMHGLGNDFVIMDGRAHSLPALTPALVTALSDRHTGIGCDQLIALYPSARGDLRMTIHNADGTEVEACGNATRAVGLLIGGEAVIETVAGLLQTASQAGTVTVQMGKPVWEWDRIPLAYAMDTLTMPVGWDDLATPAAVNVGNPHLVFFVPDSAAVPLGEIGPVIEHDPLFPDRINVNVAQVIDRSTLRLRVWERGAGLTRACGTGACATAVAAMRRGLVDRAVNVELPGGTLQIEWRDDDTILMSGSAAESFRGDFDPDVFSR